MSPDEKREYEVWLRKEIARLQTGGEPPPWRTREQEIAYLEAELVFATSTI